MYALADCVQQQALPFRELRCALSSARELVTARLKRLRGEPAFRFRFPAQMLIFLLFLFAGGASSQQKVVRPLSVSKPRRWRRQSLLNKRLSNFCSFILSNLQNGFEHSDLS